MYWVWNITDLGHKEGEGFGKGVTHTHTIFLGVPPSRELPVLRVRSFEVTRIRISDLRSFG